MLSAWLDDDDDAFIVEVWMVDGVMTTNIENRICNPTSKLT